MVDGCKVLRTLQSIKSLVDDGPKDEITTQVWTFTRPETQLSEDFILGMQDFSDTSFTRGVDLSKAQEAEQLVNQFVEKTSDGKVKNAFKDLNSSSDLQFLTLFNFQGVSLMLLRTYKVNISCFYLTLQLTRAEQFVENSELMHLLPVNDCAICVYLGSWKTAFQPENTSLQEFHVDEATTVMAPLMTHTGRYYYVNDKVKTFICQRVLAAI